MYYVVVVLVCAIRPGCPVGSGIAGVRHALSPRRAVLPRPAPRGTTHPTLRSQGNQGGEQDTQGRGTASAGPLTREVATCSQPPPPPLATLPQVHASRCL